jgi:hypothetical protein
MNLSDIDTSPIATESASYQDKELIEPRTGLLLLSERQAGRVPPRVIAGVGVLIFVVSVVLLPILTGFRSDIWPGVLLGAALALLFLYFARRESLRRPARFDATQGTLTYGPQGQRRTRPLPDIRAVQLIRGRYVSASGDVDSGRPAHQPYELNLVFADRSRLNLSNNAALPWTRESGEQIAKFLQVPLLDQIDQGS